MLPWMFSSNEYGPLKNKCAIKKIIAQLSYGTLYRDKITINMSMYTNMAQTFTAYNIP